MTQPQFKCALRRSPPDLRDWKYHEHIVGAVSIPASLSLLNTLNTVRDQGTLGTCAAFAGSAMKESQERKDINYTGYFSPWFIYLNRNTSGGTEGMYLRNVMQILQAQGVASENDVPYHPATNISQISDNIKADAKIFFG